MTNKLEPDLLERVLGRYCHIEVGMPDWREQLQRMLRAPAFPNREREFRQQLAYSILNHTITPAQYEKLTDLELETQEEVEQELRQLWSELYGDEPLILNE
jgi:hypothetical protein